MGDLLSDRCIGEVEAQPPVTAANIHAVAGEGVEVAIEPKRRVGALHEGARTDETRIDLTQAKALLGPAAHRAGLAWSTAAQRHRS